MLNIPETVKALFKRDGVYKNFRVHFPNGELSDLTNENVMQESVKFTESVCSQDVFKFGLTEASVIEFETVGVANMYGMTIECSCEIDCSSLPAADKAAIAAGTWDGTWDGVNEVFAVPYGTFRVESCPRDHQAMTHRRVTAYTASLNNVETKAFPFLPEEAPWNSLKIRIDAILSLFFGYGLTEEDASEFWQVPENAPYQPHKLYMENGDTVSFTRPYSDTNGIVGMVVYDNNYSRWWGNQKSFFKLDGMEDYSLSDYEDFGRSFVDAFNELGYDVTYDQNGNKKYETNYDAIKAEYPYLFSPCIEYAVLRPKDATRAYLRYPIDYDLLLPAVTDVYYSDQSTRPNQNFAIYPNDKTIAVVKVSVLHICAGDSQTLNWDAIVSSETYFKHFQFTPQNPLPAQISGKVYSPQHSGIQYLAVDNGGKAGKLKGYDYQDRAKQLQMYSYGNTFDTLEMINGALEIEAKFATASRSGGNKIIGIDNNSSVVVIPGEYRQMWFDEYNVEPIGTIRYAYTDEAGEEQIVDYKFGDGASIYDMTDNEVLKLMDGADPSVIEAMLDAYFIPHIAAVNFVPIDLAMKGLPYLEAGDALSVTAQDGTVCNSYALRHEISGIQALEAQIDSQSGLIIESEAAT